MYELNIIFQATVSLSKSIQVTTSHAYSLISLFYLKYRQSN